MKLFNLFRRGSAPVARERLQILLAHERSARTEPDLLAFLLNQCAATYRSSRASEAAKGLTCLGVLAEPMLSLRMDYQDAIAVGLGVTEYDPNSKAAHEIRALWDSTRAQIAQGGGDFAVRSSKLAAA